MEQFKSRHIQYLERAKARKDPAAYWSNIMKNKTESNEFKPYEDLADKDYPNMLLQYFGDLKMLAGKKYLDIGAGFGSKLHDSFKELRVNFTNVDIAYESIKFLKEKGEKGVVADAYRLPFPNNSIDGAISVNLINIDSIIDLNDCYYIFREINRVLINGGIFIQSNYGSLVKPIDRYSQLTTLQSTGFSNIKNIQTQDMSTLSDFQPLSFIATKINR